MTLPRGLPAGLGTAAILATTATLATHIILAECVSDLSSSIRATFIVAAILEAFVLAALCWFITAYLKSTWIHRGRRFDGIWFGTSLLLCTVAAAVSVAAVVNFSSTAEARSSKIFGSDATGFLIGSAVTLGLSFPMQLVFFVIHFIVGRIRGQHDREEDSLHPEVATSSPPPQVKSIGYHETSASVPKGRNRESWDSRTPPGSSGGRSTTDTVNSIRSSLSHVVRPISSKTRLLAGHTRRPSQKSTRRPTSLDKLPARDRQSHAEDGFDSWDTSAVDPQNRQTVLDTSSPTPARFLETIPASPTPSRSPSPGTPLDLEPPRTRRRSRSYSPAADRARQSQRGAFTQHTVSSESHIHPLFRSDSPAPPLIATPGTMVIAAPNAGQVISDRASIRSLHRMRSGSLPPIPSPLSRQGSLESFRKADASSSDVQEESEPNTPTAPEGGERKMTPPIPEWILTAGTRTSLTGYNTRKLKTPEKEKEKKKGDDHDS